MPYHDYQGYATDLEERDSLVANLGTHNWLILLNHGLLVAGPQIWTAFRWMFSLETACRVQVACMAGGTKLRLPTDDVVAHAASQSNRPRNEDEPDEEWPAHLEMLDAVDPSFRD
jgi:ribulose-5-phosphate 4-epimerase/fuculose-1-phosphate aldolase